MEGYVLKAPDTLKLKAFCIEAYREKHRLTALETLDLFEKFGVLDFLKNPPLRWQRVEDTVLDIEEFIAVRSRRRAVRMSGLASRTRRPGSPSC